MDGTGVFAEGLAVVKVKRDLWGGQGGTGMGAAIGSGRLIMAHCGW
jgi:hypothetical protein